MTEIFKDYQALPPEEKLNEHLWLISISEDFEKGKVIKIEGLDPSRDKILVGHLLIPLLQVGYPYFVIVHNHPNGKLEFSKEDFEFWKRVKKAMARENFFLLDLICFSDNGFYMLISKRKRRYG